MSRIQPKVEVYHGIASLYDPAGIKPITVTVKMEGIEAENFRNWCAMQGINSVVGAKIIWGKGWSKNFGLPFKGIT